MLLCAPAWSATPDANHESIHYQCLASGQAPDERQWRPLGADHELRLQAPDVTRHLTCHILVKHRGQPDSQMSRLLTVTGTQQSTVTASTASAPRYEPIWSSPRSHAYSLPANAEPLQLQLVQVLPLAARISLHIQPASEYLPGELFDSHVRVATVIILLMLGVLAGLFSLAMRDVTIGWFMGYTLSLAGVWYFFSGFAVSPGGLALSHPQVMGHLIPLTYGLVLMCGLRVGADLCRLSVHAPRAYRVIKTIGWGLLTFSMLSLLPGLYEPVLHAFSVVALLAIAALLLPGLLALRAGDYRASLFYLAGWLPAILSWGTMLLIWISYTPGQAGIFTHLLVEWRNNGVLPQWLGKPQARQFALILENLIFAVALADRVTLARQAHERELTHDVTTHLFNRAGLHLHAERWLQRMAGKDQAAQKFTVVLLDILRFGNLNQTLGYEAGDLVLRETARRLLDLWRDHALIARVGSNHFAVLLDHRASEDDVRALIEKLSRRPITIEGQALDISLCAGMLHQDDQCLPLDQLLRRAEVALTAAKRDKLCCVAYQPSMDERRRFQLSLMSSLRGAMANNDLQLAFQPKVSIMTGRPMGAEALLRWYHPEHGLIPPLDFLPFAEQTGLITEVTQWVMAQAMTLSTQWVQRGIHLKLSINISASDLGDPQFVPRTAALLKRTGADPEWMRIEITESEVMRDPEQAMAALQGLRDLGLSLSIDDFGTGNSSLAYLQRMPLQELKVDRSFVREARNNVRARLLMSNIVQMAHQLGLHVVAEGVENREEWDCVAAANCDEVQGYMVSRPLSLEHFNAWLEAHPVYVPPKLTAPA